MSCWPIMQKFTLKLKSSPKTCFFRRYGQNDGGSLEYRSFDHDTLFEFHEFQRNEVMDRLWWKFMIKKCFKQRVMIKISIFQRTAIILSISSKKHVFGELLSFKLNFCIIGQQDISVDRNFYMTKKFKLYSTKPYFQFFHIFRGSWDISVFRVIDS